ncbi:MAG TPA: alpha/beta hydrolase [Steroidobacteraceae bacterium]|jgi:pimeloyl-ACP methyl ester carboxylesterase|nr:alpha/beta hydrolase [Steroidobacteraceae bacterium]
MTKQLALLENGVTLAYDISGALSQPVVMPILGITDNVTDWPDRMCAPFVAAGYCVVRHESRDMGWSTQMDGAQYGMEDIVADTLALMDQLKIRAAHFIGYSFGGAIAQLLALADPARVRSLVLLQSTNYNPALPARSPAVLAAMNNACIEYATAAEAIAAIKAVRLACNGSTHAMSDAQAQSSAERSVARAYCPLGTARMIEARKRTAAFFERLPAITAPTLVLQGSEDPIFPCGHGEDIARRIQGAQLEYMRGAGHNHPDSLVPQMLASMLGFLR